MGGSRSQRPGPLPTLGSLGTSHQRRHKSRVSLRGPPCVHGILGTLHRAVCDICAPNPTSLKACLTVMSNNNLLVSYQTCFVVADALSSRPSIMRVTQCLLSRSARSFGCPSSLSLHLAPYILPHIHYRRLAHAH